jgi:glycerol-3-phosphate acyltransferase PlsX
MLTIALDAMGGDHAPKNEVQGAVQAARSLGVKVILVGRSNLVQQELRKYDDYQDLPIEIVHAEQVITMDDSTDAVRTKKDSSLKVASRLVRDGKAQGLVSTGNTGAVMATAKIVQGVRGIPHRQRFAGSAGGCGRQRGLLPPTVGSICRHG